MDDPAQATIQTCITELSAAASAEGAKEVRFTTHRVTPRRHGIRSTKLRVRITYPSEIREAIVVCQVDTEGNVKIITEEEAQ